VGLAPRKAALTLYGLTYYGSNTDLVERLGPHTTGKGCVHVKRLADVDREVLTDLVRRAWETTNEQPC
jgi:predicted GIY-YIG superfamily endonuclease